MSDEALFLLVAIAGRIVAIDAGEVGSVIEVAEVTPVPRVAPHIIGLHALRSRVLTVVDPRVSLGEAGDIAYPASAVVLEVEGHGYALIVDEVLDVVTVRPAIGSTAVLGPDWTRAVTGRITVEGDPILVVSPTALIAGSERQAA